MDVVGFAERRAQQLVLKDRIIYDPFMCIIEAYASKNKLLIGGSPGTSIILKSIYPYRVISVNDYVYDLYTDNTVIHARTLADSFFQLNERGQYTKVSTRIPPNKLLTIDVNGRCIVILHLIPTYREKSLFKLLTPFVSDGLFIEGKVRCLGPEIQLLICYQKLIDPGQRTLWAELISMEADMRVIMKKDMKQRFKLTSGGRPTKGTKMPISDRETLVSELLDNFVPGAGRIFVFKPDVNYLFDRIQLITWNEFEDEEDAIRSMCKKLSIEISVSVQDPQLPTDPKLRRMTFYYHNKAKKRHEAFLDMFNILHYSLVPYHTDKSRLPKGIKIHGDIKIGTPFVQMYICLIDLWLYQMLFYIQLIKPETIGTIIRKTVTDFVKHGSAYEEMVAEKKYELILPSGVDRYQGRYSDPLIIGKRDIRVAQSMPDRSATYLPYYPISHSKK